MIFGLIQAAISGLVMPKASGSCGGIFSPSLVSMARCRYRSILCGEATLAGRLARKEKLCVEIHEVAEHFRHPYWREPRR